MPEATPLRRYEPGQPVLAGRALLGAAPEGRLTAAIAETLHAIRADAYVVPKEHLRRTVAGTRLVSTVWQPDDEQAFGALVFDASGIESTERLHELYEFFQPVIRRLEPSGRLIVLGTTPNAAADPRAATAQQALEGFVRAVGKEVGQGATTQLVYVEPGAEDNIESTLRFLLSSRSAYVSGQVVRVGAGSAVTPYDWDRPLDGKVAVVTGASRGIGEAIAETLSRDGAHVVCLDVPPQGEALAAVANRIGGSTMQLDITADEAPRTLAEHLRERHGGVDVVVHNAGVTRDKTLGRMADDQWDAVMEINLSSEERINEVLLEEGVLNEDGRIVCVSSLSGIAGNRGQSNYSASKAGVIGMVEAMAPVVAERGATINAVAPGFIETQMTAAMPFVAREAGRRMNSLNQGGLPIDVAEAIAWLSSPASGGVNGNVVRVCGQSMLGA